LVFFRKNIFFALLTNVYKSDMPPIYFFFILTTRETCQAIVWVYTMNLIALYAIVGEERYQVHLSTLYMCFIRY
jgi:hypothetical protein